MDYNIEIWKGQYIGNEVCIDTETDIQPFTSRKHKLITFQAYAGEEVCYFVERKHVRKFMKLHKNSKLIMQNAPFDMQVISKLTGWNILYNFYDNNKVFDTKTMYKLYNLAAIGVATVPASLKVIAKKLLNIDLDKNEDVRCTFDQYDGWPIGDIPEKHLRYAAEDAVVTFKVYQKLLELIEPHDTYKTLLSQHIQVKGELALDQIYKNGIGFDVETKDKWLVQVEKDMKMYEERMAVWGYIKGRKGVQTDFHRILKHLNIYDNLPLTEKGNKCTSADQLKKYCDKPFISDYLAHAQLKTNRDFVSHDSKVLNPRYDSIKNTGRTGASGPNIQNVKKNEDIKDMFIPKDENNVFVDIDYKAIEMATLAQICISRYGSSVMADKINAGEDLHTYYATQLYNKDAKDVTPEERQSSKAPNFGYPGGLGVEKFITYAKGYGLNLTLEESQKYKDTWFDAYPEMREYMNGEVGEVYSLTGRKRGDTFYCAEKNTPFQGLAADGAKLAMYAIQKAGYEMVAFIHDAIIVECHKDVAEEVLEKVSKIMIKEMKKVTPDVRISTEGVVASSLAKRSEILKKGYTSE